MTPALVSLRSHRDWRARLFGVRPTAASRGLTLLLLLVGLGTWGLAGFAWLDARRSVSDAAQQHRIHTARTEAALRIARTTAPRPNEQHVSEVTEVVRRLDFPWPRLFDELERLTPEGVIVLELSQDAERGQLQMLVQTFGAKDAFELVERLKAAQSLSAARVLRYEEKSLANTRAVQVLLHADLATRVPGQEVLRGSR